MAVALTEGLGSTPGFETPEGVNGTTELSLMAGSSRVHR